MIRLLPILLLAGFLATSAPAAELLTTQHVDLAVNFQPTLVGTATNPWRLTARDEDTRREFGGQRAGIGDALQVILRAGLDAQFPIPDDADYSFLGTPGAPVWVLPQTQESGIPFLGVSTENKTAQSWSAFNVDSPLLARGIASGTFASNQVTLRLETFSGPGNFFVWSTDSFGTPLPRFFDTSNGLSAADGRPFTPANHSHFNWAFTAPGIYELGLRASGTLTAGAQFSQSELTTFRFEVIPEPGSAALLLAGLASLALRRRLTRRGLRGRDRFALR